MWIVLLSEINWLGQLLYLGNTITSAFFKLQGMYIISPAVLSSKYKWQYQCASPNKQYIRFRISNTCELDHCQLQLLSRFGLFLSKNWRVFNFYKKKFSHLFLGPLNLRCTYIWTNIKDTQNYIIWN